MAGGSSGGVFDDDAVGGIYGETEQTLLTERTCKIMACVFQQLML